MQKDRSTSGRSASGRRRPLIARRLDDPPQLQELTRALAGETVARSVRRLRLEASQQMVQASDAKWQTLAPTCPERTGIGILSIK